MMFTYVFKNSEDTIENLPLNRSRFNAFVQELKSVNTDHMYNIYLYGSYMDYRIDQTPYKDINFVVTREKVLVVGDLESFMQKFHNVCKKYNVGYSLIYGSNLGCADINKNNQENLLFTIAETQALSLYKNRLLDGVAEGSDYQQFKNTNLFINAIHLKNHSEKIMEKRRTRKNFQIPMKIE